MYVIKKLQLNRFKAVPYCTARQMFLATGEKPAVEQSKETIDCAGQPTTLGAKKTQLLQMGFDMAQSAYAKRESYGNSPSLTPTNPKDR